MSIKEEIQNSLDESGDGYQLKTNKELTNIISEFGCGETEFHTADISRLIKENEEFKNRKNPPCLSCKNFYGECQLSAGQQLHCINNKWSEFKKGDWKVKQAQENGPPVLHMTIHQVRDCPHWIEGVCFHLENYECICSHVECSEPPQSCPLRDSNQIFYTG